MKFKSTYKIGICQKTGSVDVLMVHLATEPTEKEREWLISEDKPKVIEIYDPKEKRTYTANSYMWVLLGKLSEKLTIPKGDVYVKMLKRFGESTSVIVKSEALDQLSRNWNASNTSVEHTEPLTEVIKEYAKNGVKWSEVLCYFGSSGYNRQEFKKLLDGVISECQLLEIEVLPNAEIQRLIEQMDDL
jgi:hypothetical protein